MDKNNSVGMQRPIVLLTEIDTNLNADGWIKKQLQPAIGSKLNNAEDFKFIFIRMISPVLSDQRTKIHAHPMHTEMHRSPPSPPPLK